MQTREGNPAPQESKPKEKKKIVIVEHAQTVAAQARDAAEAALTASKQELKGVKGFAEKIWKHNLFHEYYRQKEIAKVKSRITQSKNIFAAETTDRVAHEKVAQDLVERFSQEYDETLHKEVNEERKTLKKEGAEQIQRTRIKEAIARFATDALTRDEFLEERTRILSELTGLTREQVQTEVQHADNLLEIARQVKQSIEHGARLEDLDLDFDVVVGKAKTGVRTEAQFNTVDRLVEKLQSTSIGRLVNETTLASAVSLVYSITAGLSQSVARSKLAAWGTFGVTAVVSGGLAGARESHRLEEERRQHFREMAQGKKFDAAQSPRRAQMETFRYATMQASDVLASFESFDREMLTQAQADSLLAHLASVEAGIQISDRRNVDLIAYSHGASIESERTKIDIARAKAKVLLRRLSDEKKIALPNNADFATYFDSLKQTQARLIEGDTGMEAKNRAFQKMKKEKVAVAAFTGLGSGLLMGGVFQEAAAWARDNQEGIIEGLFDKTQTPVASVTALERLRMWISGETMPSAPSQTFSEHALFGGEKVKLQDGVGLVPQDKNPAIFNLTRDGEVIARGIEFKDGKITPESVLLLDKEGVTVSEEIRTTVSHVQGQAPVPEYIQEHPDLFQRIRRTLWYDIDTPKPIFEKNELRLDWGGGGDGIDAQGRYTFNIARMTSEGSYHGNFSVDAKAAMKEGKLKLLLSLSRETQSQVVTLPIDTRGNVIVDPNSEIGKFFFKEVNGKAVFLGQFAEVGQDMGADKDLAEKFRILATYEGEGREGIPAPVEVIEETPITTFEVPESEPFVEPPPFIPIWGRRPLEPIIHGPSPEPIVRGAYYERLKRWYTEISSYRNSEKNIEQLIQKLSSDSTQKKKYQFVLDRLNQLKKFDRLSPVQKRTYVQEMDRYNKRRFSEKKQEYIQINEFIGREIQRSYQHIENIVLKEAAIGEQPFAREFYRESPFIRGIQRSEEIVIVMNNAIGDTVLTVPILLALKEYMDRNRLQKKVKVITAHPALFKSLEHQFRGVVKVIDFRKAQDVFVSEGKKERFVINSHASFEDYSTFGLTAEESLDASRVMSVDWASWTKEEIPLRPGKIEKYETMPARILRNFEVMFGQKLFRNINAMDHFLEKSDEYSRQMTELETKYNIKANEKVIVISPGSAATAKEYTPERWIEVLTGICSKYPNVHILFLEEKNPVKRARYGEMVDKLKRQQGFKISRVSEGLNYMNTIMSRADLTITPDTGLGHLSSALGKPNIMLFLSDPVQWSTAKTIRVMHPMAQKIYAQGRGTYNKAWEAQLDEYYVTDDETGKQVGVSDIEAKRVLQEVSKILG